MQNCQQLLPAGFTLQAAKNTDTQAICDLFTVVHQEYGFGLDFEKRDADLADIEAHYPPDRAWFAVLCEENTHKLVGSVALKPVKALPKDTIELGRLYLYPQYRGKGLGKALMQIAITQARQLGYQKMVLETHSSMPEAIRLYEKFGFSQIPPFSEAGKKDLSYCDYAAELLL